MRKLALPLLLILFMLFAFTSCDDSSDSSSSSDGSSSFDPAGAHYMTMPELATIVSIFGLMDEAYDFDTEWYYVYDDENEIIDEYALVDYDGDGEYDDGVYRIGDNWIWERIFIDSDGDAEYDEGEQLIYYYEITDPLDDGDDNYAWYETYGYSDDASGDSLKGTVKYSATLDGYSEYSSEESDSYIRYVSKEYTLEASIGGEEHTLDMTVEYTSTRTRTITYNSNGSYTKSTVASDYYTDSEACLDGVTLYGYEDYMNVLSYYS